MKLTWANQITILRILLIAPFVICMLKADQTNIGRAMRYIALVIFLFMCISDALDGYMARVKKQVTTLGTFLDPMADKLLMMCACILLASSKTAIDGFVLPSAVVVLIIGKDVLLLLGFIIVYFITSHIRIVPVFLGKVGTVLQLSMVAAMLMAPEVTLVFSGWIYLIKFLWYAVSVSAVLVTLIYIRTGILYIEQFEEPQKSQ